MNSISFQSSYKIYLNPPKTGIKKTQKKNLRNYAQTLQSKYPRSVNVNSSSDNIKISVRKKFDKQVEQKLKEFSFNRYDKIEFHNIPENKLNNAFKKIGEEHLGFFDSKKHGRIPLELIQVGIKNN